MRTTEENTMQRKTLRRQIIDRCLILAEMTGDDDATSAVYRLIAADRRNEKPSKSDVEMRDMLMEFGSELVEDAR